MRAQGVQSLDDRLSQLSPGWLALLGAFGAVLLTWLGPLAYPFRLLTTLVHELSHGLVAVITGGSFVRFVIFGDGSGVATTAGGARLLVIPAGYVGVAVAGAVLLYLGRNPRTSRHVLGLMGGMLMLLTLRYALPTLFSMQVVGGLLTLVMGVGLGAAMLAIAWWAGRGLALALLNLVAVHLGLSAFGDLWTLFTLSALGVGRSDAASMAALTRIPAPFWATVWALLAATLLGTAVWLTWLRPRTR